MESQITIDGKLKSKTTLTNFSQAESYFNFNLYLLNLFQHS